MAKKRRKIGHVKNPGSSHLLVIFMTSLGSIFCCIVLLVATLLLTTTKAESQTTLHLGYDNYQKGKEESSPVLGSTTNSNVILHGDRNKKQIALTFDAEMTYGMKEALTSGAVSSSYDKRITDTLVKTNTPATLFITGMWAQLYPNAVTSFARNKLFEIGSHSYIDSSYSGTCYGLKPTDNSEDLEELESTQKIFHDLTGKDPKLFRFPGGCYDDYDVSIVTNVVGLKIVHWDVVGGDGFNNNTNSIVQNVVNNTQNGSIIVLHMNGAPTAPKTADALPVIISQLKQKGFRFVTVSHLLGL